MGLTITLRVNGAPINSWCRRALKQIPSVQTRTIM